MCFKCILLPIIMTIPFLVIGIVQNKNNTLGISAIDIGILLFLCLGTIGLLLLLSDKKEEEKQKKEKVVSE